ncbi:hypothetical protein BJAS_P3401 [Bathymodiolus japonicus methanotrophic gill symbiont]|uniref:hypothetical protein n=1 Tax=Bathymodiolus japonicus methanotrophic gill symbiont TaxID=113269 RepID=UPI001B734EE9|nr:hypothetical protein [Bathymodiolus japonicus methanotrophic gill symbiont]GFO72865.1 hypothetical protein BJAS_P3401 [Bathymodiolus japonicus methanotrophic gill symbiont]
MNTLETSINRLASSIEDLVDLMIIETKQQKEQQREEHAITLAEAVQYTEAAPSVALDDQLEPAKKLPTVKERAAEVKKIAVDYVRNSRTTNDAVKSILTNMNLSRIDDFTTHDQIESFEKSLEKLVNRGD